MNVERRVTEGPGLGEFSDQFKPLFLASFLSLPTTTKTNNANDP